MAEQPALFADLPPAARGVQPAQPVLARPGSLAALPGRLWLGTSSWSFPGWTGLVWQDEEKATRLSREGLPAYATHPLLNAVGVDRSFHADMDEATWRRHAEQVPADFRFVAKAPATVTDATRRDANGRAMEANPLHLDAQAALERFVRPCAAGLGDRLGWLVFQFPPLPADWLAAPRAWTDRLERFLSALPSQVPKAVELRDAALVTPRLMDLLRAHDTLYCLALHDRMPPVDRQLRALERWAAGDAPPVLARWTLRRGLGYEAARGRYAPFDRLVDPDPTTRAALAGRIRESLAAGREVSVIANNKAEGSAPRTLQALAQAVAGDA